MNKRKIPNGVIQPDSNLVEKNVLIILLNKMISWLVNNSNQWKKPQSPVGEDGPAPNSHGINEKEF